MRAVLLLVPFAIFSCVAREAIVWKFTPHPSDRGVVAEVTKPPESQDFRIERPLEAGNRDSSSNRRAEKLLPPPVEILTLRAKTTPAGMVGVYRSWGVECDGGAWFEWTNRWQENRFPPSRWKWEGIPENRIETNGTRLKFSNELVVNESSGFRIDMVIPRLPLETSRMAVYFVPSNGGAATRLEWTVDRVRVAQAGLR